MSEEVRIQFNLPGGKVEELDQLMETAGIKTRRELFNNALSLLEWAVEQRENGRIVGSIDTDTDSYRELYMPIFGNIKKKTKDRVAAA